MTGAHLPTSERMRHDIRGKAGDKVDHADPAATLLGTDDEAAGNPPSLEELRIAAATAPSKSTSDSTFGVGSFYVAIVIAVALTIIAALTLR